jgi:thymidylate synthase (FAD)
VSSRLIEVMPGIGGFVRIDGHMADDMSVVNAARVSFANHSSELHDELTGKDKGLINFLMRERHGTPFEHNAMRFHVKCPLFVAREWFRHRIGSFNEFSARYSEVPDEFHVPRAEDIRTQVGKPGAYSFETINENDPRVQLAITAITSNNAASYRLYRDMVESGVAKEVARMVLPVSMFTQFYWTVNARSLMNFLSLRMDINAQLEIREYANAVAEIFKEIMPVTYQAWVDNGMKTP